MTKALTLFAGASAALLAACNPTQPAANDQAGPVSAAEPAAYQATADIPLNETDVVPEEANAADPVTPTAEPKSCEADIGKQAAAGLAKRCRFVSPATRPPCHPANPCEMIQREIDRSCAMFGDDQPAACKAAAAGS